MSEAPGPAVGDTVEATVDRLAYGGEGVARVEGLVVFVPWTAPGDRVEAHVVERKASWARTRLTGVLEPGPDRVEPGCPVYGVCGGCRLQHLSPEAQRRAKSRAVADSFARIAGVRLEETPECPPPIRPWHYRQRAVFSWRWRDERLVVGFHAAADPADLVAVDACPILAEPGNRALADLVVGLRRGLAQEDPTDGRLAIRCPLPGTVQAGVFAPDPRLARTLAKRCEEAAGIPVTWGAWTGEGGGIGLASDAPRLEVHVPYRGLSLRVGFDSFLQADREAAEVLYDAVLEELDPGPEDRVIDGYAGIGAVTCRLAADGIPVTAVEVHAGAASDLRANADAVDGAPVHVLQIPAERMDWSKPGPTAIVLNPPRSGCSGRVLEGVTRSPARRLVYVSCDPTTLARDVRRLGDRWRLEHLRVFDLFPQTPHVETVLRLERVRRPA